MPVRKSVKAKTFRKPAIKRRGYAPAFYRRRMIPQGPSPERKAIDVGPGTYECSSTGSITLINPCARGDALNERIGRKTFMRTVQVVGQVSPTDTTGILQVARVLVVYDSQPNAAAPGITDILTAATDRGLVNLSNSLRFKIVMDKRYALYDNTGTSCRPEIIDEFRILNLPVHYNSGDAGTIADITTGALWLITCGDAASGTTDSTAKITTRVRYTDA